MGNEGGRNPLPKRKDIRLSGYDYSQGGCYFVTLCTYEKAHTLCTICRGDPCGRPQIIYSHLGRVAEKILCQLEERFPIELMGYVIMPNHIHFLMYLQSDDERATARVAPTVGQIIGAYKSLVVHQWRGICNDNRVKMGVVWQRNYYEHIIRNEMDFTETIKYIDENPLRWLTGEE